MNQDLGVIGNTGGRQRVKRGGGAVHTFGATVDNHAHFGVSHIVNQRFDRRTYLGIDHHHDVTDTPATLERLDAPAHDGLAAHRDKLLGAVGVKAGTEAGRQHHGHHRRGLCGSGGCGFRDIGVSLSHSHHRKGRSGRS